MSSRRAVSSEPLERRITEPKTGKESQLMLTRRRVRSLTITMAAVAVTALGIDWIGRNLGNESTFSGIILLLSTASLYLLSLRKKWIARRLGPVSAWLQMHVYVGVFTSLLFLMHIGWPIRGPFELCLAACFCFVALTGVLLAIMSRLTPLRLSALQADHSLERIPALQLAVAEDAHRTAMNSSKLGEGATLSEYYQRRLISYFHSNRSWFYRLWPTSAKRRQLIRELEDLDRYLSMGGLDCRRQLSSMVQSKDDLDYQSALQARLKLFFAMHCALTWTLIILVTVHVTLVVRFSGALL